MTWPATNLHPDPVIPDCAPREVLLFRVRQLERALIDEPRAWIPTTLGLGRIEEILFGVLCRRRTVVSRAVLYDAVYGLRPDGGPDPKIIDVFLSRLRHKVAPLGVTIVNRTGQGWLVDERGRDVVAALQAAAGVDA